MRKAKKKQLESTILNPDMNTALSLDIINKEKEYKVEEV